jgi:hypothetical protein
VPDAPAADAADAAGDPATVPPEAGGVERS